MPKQKTHSSAKKRFKLSATGKLSRRQAYQSHNLGAAKSPKRKRAFGHDQPVDDTNRPAILRMLGRR